MGIADIVEVLKQMPLVALCVILIYILKTVYKDLKKEHEYRDAQDSKNLETLTRVLEVVKENALESRNLKEEVEEFKKILYKVDSKLSNNGK
jgi:hypothetical protein